MNAKPLDIRTVYGLLYGHPRETCPHCQKPKHAAKCPPQIWYEARMGRTDEIDKARAVEERESARRDDDDYCGAQNAIQWED
jgi:hypothetical protein